MRVGRLLGCIAVVELLAGCYVLQPVTSAGPEPGALVGMEVNDLGRLALGGQMGPEIQQIEGRLLSKSPEQYEVSVKSVKLIRGGNQIWNGERVTVKREYISQTFERQFSKSQTIALSAVFVASVYVVVSKLGLVGFGKEGDTTAPPNSVEAFRPRRP